MGWKKQGTMLVEEPEELGMEAQVILRRGDYTLYRVAGHKISIDGVSDYLPARIVAVDAVGVLYIWKGVRLNPKWIASVKKTLAVWFGDNIPPGKIDGSGTLLWVDEGKADAKAIAASWLTREAVILPKRFAEAETASMMKASRVIDTEPDKPVPK